MQLLLTNPSDDFKALAEEVQERRPDRSAIGQTCTAGKPGCRLGWDFALAVKPKDFVFRHVGLYHKHGASGHLEVLKDVSLLPVRERIDATDHVFYTGVPTGRRAPGAEAGRSAGPAGGARPGSGDDPAAPALSEVCAQPHYHEHQSACQAGVSPHTVASCLVAPW